MMKLVSKTALLNVLLLSVSTVVDASPTTSLIDISQSILNRSRRTLNLSNLFGSPSSSSVSASDRISSQPVFTVTTPWGSPYLLFERRDRSETTLEFDESNQRLIEGGDGEDEDVSATQERSERGMGENHQVALYFLDENDALRLRDEMLQMPQMAGADMRITVSSLSKALSQTKNLHKGLLTGQPNNDMTGRMKNPEEGGVLRYKIVPPKRELFYAARCKGRERVGLFSERPEADAELMTSSMPFIGSQLAKRRTMALEKARKRARAARRGDVLDGDEDLDPVRREYAHMEGFIGVPVFHCESLKKYNTIKGVLRGNAGKNKVMETPLFFSYDDLMDSWKATKDKIKDDEVRSQMPETPDVEVYNMMDVVTSLDRHHWNTKRASSLRRSQLLSKIPGVSKVLGTPAASSSSSVKDTGLGEVVFVPSSKRTKFKEIVSSVGSGKSRGLRPMKPWGKDAM